MSLLELHTVSKAYDRTGFLGRRVGTDPALSEVSLALDAGEAVGVVGESGAGKSTLARVAAGLDSPSTGSVRFDGRPMADAERGRVGFVFQRPDGSFDPRMEVLDSVAEPLRIAGVERGRARERARESLEVVGVEGAAVYPHELSGGQAARAALARALVTDPDLLVLDEPTSALDAGVQATVLSVLARRRREGLAVLLVAHDLRVVRSLCGRAHVLYAGESVAAGPLPELFDDPAHPYTRALVRAETPYDPRAEGGEGLPGDPANAADPPVGCRFHPRCPDVILPEAYDGSPEGFRAALRFRRSLAAGDTPVSPPPALRERFALPDSLGDPDAERCLDAALARAADGERAAAAALLSRVFETPCERTNPELRDAGDERAACLRVEE
jgi:peptide/nickel transport system ATP-binding protein